MAFAPVALFVYNRALHVERTLERLVRNVLAPQTPLVVFSDGPKSEEDVEAVQAVRTLIKRGWGFGSVKVVEAGRNKGLARSIIEGITEVLRDHDRVIVIEDDIVTAPATLEYFNAALAYYRDTSAVFSISAYSHPSGAMQLPKDYDYDAYCIPRMMCWGWATWRDRWGKADWKVKDFQRFLSSPSTLRAYADYIGRDSLGTLKACMAGEKDVWACRWVYTHFKHRAVCVCPVVSYVDNIGLDGSGANCGTDMRLKNNLAGPYPERPRFPEQVFVDPAILAAFMNVYDGRLRKRPAAAPVKHAMFKGLCARGKGWLTRLPERILNQLTQTPRQVLSRLGTQYGGWCIIDGWVKASDVVISAGAGEDISFDVELTRRTGCRVHLLDPTPRAVQHFETTKELIAAGRPAPINNSETEHYPAYAEPFERLSFHPVGLWSSDITARFYEPRNNQHVSHSIGNLQGTDAYFEARCLRLWSFLDQVGVKVKEVAVVKMDIEGAEFEVLRDMLLSRIRPKLLLVEFHAGKSELEKKAKLRTIFHVLLLWACGYRLIDRSGWNYMFARRVLLAHEVPLPAA